MACVLLLCSSHYWAIHFVPINKPVLSVCQTAIQPVSQWTHATGTRVPGHHSHKKHMHLIVLLFRYKWNRIGIWGQTAYSTGIWFTRYTHSNSIRRIATVSHAAAQRQTGANKNRGLECVPPIFFFCYSVWYSTLKHLVYNFLATSIHKFTRSTRTRDVLFCAFCFIGRCHCARHPLKYARCWKMQMHNKKCMQRTKMEWQKQKMVYPKSRKMQFIAYVLRTMKAFIFCFTRTLSIALNAFRYLVLCLPPSPPGLRRLRTHRIKHFLCVSTDSGCCSTLNFPAAHNIRIERWW